MKKITKCFIVFSLLFGSGYFLYHNLFHPVATTEVQNQLVVEEKK